LGLRKIQRTMMHQVQMLTGISCGMSMLSLAALVSPERNS